MSNDRSHVRLADRDVEILPPRPTDAKAKRALTGVFMFRVLKRQTPSASFRDPPSGPVWFRSWVIRQYGRPRYCASRDVRARNGAEFRDCDQLVRAHLTPDAYPRSRSGPRRHWRGACRRIMRI